MIALAVSSMLTYASPAAAVLDEDAPLYLDRSLDGNGMQVLPIAFRPGEVQIDSPGRILLSGTADGSTAALLRFDPEMNLDPSFGGDGSISLPLTDPEVRVNPDDSITTLSRGDGNWVRTDFTENGTQSAALEFDAPTQGGGIAALTPEGGLWAFRDEGNELVLRRYLATGTEDPSFTPKTFDDGRCELGGPCFYAYPQDLATSPNGTLLFGMTTVFTRGVTEVFEYSTLAPGETDLHPVGRISSSSGFAHIRSAVLDPDGGFLVRGVTGPNPIRAHFIRALANGQPNLSFSGGQASVPLPDSPNSFAISKPGFDADDGFYFTALTGAYSDLPLGLRHYLPDGTYDKEFEQGSERVDFSRDGTGQIVPAGTVVDDAGRPLLIGSVDDGGTRKLAIARWTPEEPELGQELENGKIYFSSSFYAIWESNPDGTHPDLLVRTDAPPDDVSDDGEYLVYTDTTSEGRESGVYILPTDRESGPVNLTPGSPGEYVGEASFGPRGQIAFVSDRDGSRDIHVMNLDGSGRVNLTPGPEYEYNPEFLPGGRVAYYGQRGNSDDILVTSVDDPGSEENLTSADPRSNYFRDVSPDGRTIVYGRDEDDVLANLDGSNERLLIDNQRFGGSVYVASFSPDGLSFVASEYTGPPEYDSGIAIRTLDDPSTDVERIFSDSYAIVSPVWGTRPYRLPETRIVAGPDGTLLNGQDVTFEFESSIRYSGFECALAHGLAEPVYSRCASGIEYDGLEPGDYEFLVRSVLEGESEPVPASREFTIAEPEPELEIEIDHLRKPAELSALIRRGVSARVECSLDCRATMRITVSQRTADAVGLDTRVIGRGSRSLTAGEPEILRALVDRGAVDELEAQPNRQLPYKAKVSGTVE